MTITEPGIIGKIGFNSFGTGVGLNFLGVETDLIGLPIHVVLRAALECSSIAALTNKIIPKVTGTAGHILIVDKNKQYRSLEFGGDFTFEVRYPEDFEGSISRHEQILANINGNDMTLEIAKNILTNASNIEFPIYRRYIPNEELIAIGTVCFAIFDLDNLKLHLTKGNPFDNEFQTIQMDQ